MESASVYHVGVLMNAFQLLSSSFRQPVHADEDDVNDLHAFCISYHK